MTSWRRGRDTRSFETLEYISVAEQAACPTDAGGCGAEPHRPCVNPHTGEPLPVSHWQRFKIANQLLAKARP